MRLQSRLYGTRNHRPIHRPRHALQRFLPVLYLLDNRVSGLLGVLVEHLDVLDLLGQGDQDFAHEAAVVVVDLLSEHV